jgi:UDP-N-acetyl-D-galactosamine dehydrogenase
MGFTFKENCPDIRNTKIADLVRELAHMAGEVVVFDPYADADDVWEEYGIRIQNELPKGQFEAVALAVNHDVIRDLGEDQIRSLLAPEGVIYDLKSILPIDGSDARL